MKHYLTKQEHDEYKMFLDDKVHGRTLTPDGLRVVCEGLNNNPEAIGKHFLEVLTKFQNEGILK